jgi:hypothetical protein
MEPVLFEFSSLPAATGAAVASAPIMLQCQSPKVFL